MGYSEKLFLANDVNRIPPITSLLFRVPIGGQGPHGYTLTVLGVEHSATLSAMVPIIASMIGYIGASTASDGHVSSGEMITWIGDEGRGTCEGNEICKGNENFHVELQFQCERRFDEGYTEPTWNSCSWWDEQTFVGRWSLLGKQQLGHRSWNNSATQLTE